MTSLARPAFPGAKERAAAVVTSTLPGARMFHEGQFEGRKVRLPVFLGRRPAEPVDEELRAFYAKLLKAIDPPVFRAGNWQLCERSGWPDNAQLSQSLAWSWTDDDERYLIIVNLSESKAQGQMKIPWQEGAGRTWHLTDLLSDAVYERDGNADVAPGLYVELDPWSYNLFQCTLE